MQIRLTLSGIVVVAPYKDSGYMQLILTGENCHLYIQMTSKTRWGIVGFIHV